MLEDENISKSKRTMKEGLCLISVYLQVFNMVYNLYYWPPKWSDSFMHPNTIAFIWNCFVPITVFILIFVEAFSEKSIKSIKNYHRCTFFVYEFVWIFSIYVYINLTIGDIKKSIQVVMKGGMQNKDDDIIINVKILLTILSIGCFYFFYWMKNTIVHISLCRREVFGVKPELNQYDQSRKAHTITYILILFTGLISSTLVEQCSDSESNLIMLLYTGFAYILFLYFSKFLIHSRFFYLNKISWVEVFSRVLAVIGFIFIYTILYIGKILCIDDKRKGHNDFVHIGTPDSIMYCMCLTAIVRQWFLDVEVDPEKYAHCYRLIFKTKHSKGNTSVDEIHPTHNV